MSNTELATVSSFGLTYGAALGKEIDRLLKEKPRADLVVELLDYVERQLQVRLPHLLDQVDGTRLTTYTWFRSFLKDLDGLTIQLTAIADGRRSRRLYPDKLIGWQFMGLMDAHGKPIGAPKWVAERISHVRDEGDSYIKTTDSIVLKRLAIGDWIVCDDKNSVGGHGRVFTLGAHVVLRWYQES